MSDVLLVLAIAATAFALLGAVVFVIHTLRATGRVTFTPVAGAAWVVAVALWVGWVLAR